MIRLSPFLVLCWSLFGVSASGAEPDPELQMLRSGVRLSLVAEHPQLVTPTGIDVDAQGRIWLVASHTHFRPDNYEGPLHDEILVFTDQDEKDHSIERSVFYNATSATMDLELGPDGWVYLAERDRILRVKDSDADGVGDVEEDVAVLATEAVYPHNGLSGMTWHPDGDLIFGLGENYADPWTLTGRDGAEFQGRGEGGIFKCRPDGSRLTRIAHGLWNPFSVCVRDDGEMFAADNDPGERPPCRLLHIVDGGDYGYQRKYGNEAHHPFVCWNGESRGTLPMIHPTGEGPCGIVPVGQGVIVPSWSDHRIDFYPLKRSGSSFTAEQIPLVQGGRFFRPVCIAPDVASSQSGELTWYLTDWVSGAYQLHRLGRLWKLELDPEQADWLDLDHSEPRTDPAQLANELRTGSPSFSEAELFDHALRTDPFVAQAAIRALSHRAHTWQPADVQALSAKGRITALLALKSAADSSADGVRESEPWIRQFLKDDDQDVLFETLRWIADGEHEQFLPEVEAILNRSDLDYPLFEAGVAAWNTLHGNPEAGVRNTEMLLARVQDAESAPRLRAFALRLLPVQPRAAKSDLDGFPHLQFPRGLSVELLQELMSVGDELLSLEAVRTLAGNPVPGQHVLAQVAADQQRSDQLRAEAITGLAAVSADHLELLLKLAQSNHRSVRDEALRALRGAELTDAHRDILRKVADAYPSSADLCDAARDPQSLAKNRPALTDITGWSARLAAVRGPADVEFGRRTFHHPRVSLCSRCHRRDGRGQVVGPDLSAVGARAHSIISQGSATEEDVTATRSTRTWLLESLLQPSRKMAPEYRPRMMILKDGRVITGIRLRSSTREAIRDSNGQTQTFDRGEIETIRELDQSFMPEGMVHSLTDRELRDLIAFLESSTDP